MIENSLFNLYDPALKAAVDNLYLAWQAALSYDQEYDSKFGKTYVFTNPLDLPLPKRRQQHWDEIDAARVKMRRALDEILARLRADYVEIDLHKTNEDAWKYYREIQKEVPAGLSDEIAATKARKGNKAMPTRKLPKAKRK